MILTSIVSINLQSLSSSPKPLVIMAWYGRSSRFIFHLFRRYNSKIAPLPFISRSNPKPRIHHPTFSYFHALKNSNSNSNTAAPAVVSLNTLFSGSRISPSSIFRRSYSQTQFLQPFFSLKTAPIQEYGSRISHPIFRNLVFQNSLKNSYSTSVSQPIFRDLFFQNGLKNSKMAVVKESASQFSQPSFMNLVLHNPQEYVPLNTSRNLVSQNALKNNNYLTDGAKRLYKWWNQNPRYRKSVTIGLLGSGVAASVYFWNLETISYTKRTHLVLQLTNREKKLSQFMFELAAEECEWKILPSHHPQSIRVQKIGQEIVGALHKEEQSMKKMRSAADLEEFEWEFIVVDDPDDEVNAACLPGGKIVVSTGLLDYFKTDAEIAAIIGHEVGHASARHSAEAMFEIIPWLKILMPDCVKKMTDRFVWLPYRWRREIEADYIGLLLMASAGYDPRVAIEVCEKFDRLLDECTSPDDDDYLSTHPSEKERAQLLSKPKVMEEALSLYREALKEKEKENDPMGGHMSSFDRIIYRCVCKVLDLFFKQR